MTPKHVHPRRKDRSKGEAWIRAFLHRAGAGVFVSVRDGRPFPVPLNFVYDEEKEAVFLHTGRRGATIENLEDAGKVPGGRQVAISVFEMGRFLPADEALEFGVEYASVTVFGRGSVVTDPTAVRAALVLLMEKYAPHLKAGQDYRPVMPEEVRRTGVIRVDIEGWSGKEKREAPDFPGAYRLEDVR